MESLSSLLRGVPLFSGLPRGALARIIADLREELHPAGTVLCREGEPARDFYVIAAGTVEVVADRGDGIPEVVAVSGPRDWFGERALFTDDVRSATVVAREEVRLWRLAKDKFDALVEENPALLRHFIEVLSLRLQRGNRELSKTQQGLAAQTAARLRSVPGDRAEELEWLSLLPDPDPAALVVVLGRSVSPSAWQELMALEGFYLSAPAGRLLPGVQWALRERLVSSHGVAEVAARELRLREWLRQRETPAGEERGQVQRLRPAGAIGEEARTAASGIARPPGVAATIVTARGVAAVVGVLAALAVGLGPVPDGLDAAGMRMLALLLWAAVYWAFDVLPEYVVGLAMVVGWIFLGLVPVPVAVSGFTAGPFFLIIGVLGMGASLQASGLLFRLALQVLRRFPLTHRGQTAAVALTGTAVSPAIPDVTSAVAMASPVILALSDSLGYPRRSRGSAGIAMAGVLGFGQMSPFFFTGATENLLAWGLLPALLQSEITWLGWAQAALPMALVTFGLGLIATLRLLPPEKVPEARPGLIERQLEALGPVSGREKVNAVVLLSAMAGWMTAPLHGIDVGWVAMAGLTVLLAVDLLDRPTFRGGIHWDFLFYLGTVLSLTGVVRHLRIDEWVIGLVTPLVSPLTAHPAIFLLVLAVAIFPARFVLPSFPLVSLFVLTMLPIAQSAGISSQALLLVICTAVTPWFLPYQSTAYLALYLGTREQAFTHSQVRPLVWSYAPICLIAIAFALPWWKYLGLLP